MSIYMTFDEGPGEQVASNQGWSDLTDWVESQGEQMQVTNNMVESGGTSLIQDVVTELNASLASSPPEDESVTTTIRGVLKLLRANQDEEIVLVTDGTGPEGEGDDEETD